MRLPPIAQGADRALQARRRREDLRPRPSVESAAIRQPADRPNATIDDTASRAFAPIVNGAVTRPSFAQRHPFLSKLFGSFATVLSFPIVLAANAVATPVLMGAALVSKTFGSGDLARSIGTSRVAKALWGNEMSRDVARGELPSIVMGAVTLIPLYGPILPAMNASFDMYERVLKSLGSSAEDAHIQNDIYSSHKLSSNIASWVQSLPTEARGDIDTAKWITWEKDPSNAVWTGPLSAILQKLREGAEKAGGGAVSNQFAQRMKDVLKAIERDHRPFVPYLSTLGLSGLGTCHDRPAMTFLDLELRTQAHEALVEIKEGKQNLQSLLNVAMTRFIFDEAYQKLSSGMQSAGSHDPIEATLCAWESLRSNNTSLVPALPYRLYGSDLSENVLRGITAEVANVVRQRVQDQDAINEFLSREDSPVYWNEARNLVSTQAEMDLTKQAEALPVPEQPEDMDSDAFYKSAPYLGYLNQVQAIYAKRAEIKSGGAKFTAGKGWEFR